MSRALMLFSNMRRSLAAAVRIAAFGGAALAGSVMLTAQAGGKSQGAGAVQPVSSASVSLQSIWQATHQQDHTMLQRRRFFSGQGQPVAVRELLIVDANGTPTPDFSLTYQGVEGVLPGSPLDLQWAHTYRIHGDRFYTSGSFHVRDLLSAQQNYTVHVFSNVVRANRTATRIVIFPSRLDKAVWVVDVDTQTSLPLYTAEFDRQFRLLSELEVLTCTLSAQLPATPPASSGIVTTDLASFDDARGEFDDDSQLVEPDGQWFGEYHLRKVTVREDLLNRRKSLQMTYTDGVDEFFVLQEPGAADPFAGLPANASSASSGHTIARYGDHAMRVLMFWQDGVSFQMAGRGSLARLDGFAKRIYIKSVQN